MAACCEHPATEHGRERDIFANVDSRRELCMMCPGYVDEQDQSLYPRGKAWHRYRSGEGTPEADK